MGAQEITFRFQPSLLGSFDQPIPPIAHMDGVIVVQHGEATVGQWDAEICGFVHPSNQDELAAEALAFVLAKYPDVAQASPDVRFFTCPISLVERFEPW